MSTEHNYGISKIGSNNLYHSIYAIDTASSSASTRSITLYTLGGTAVTISNVKKGMTLPIKFAYGITCNNRTLTIGGASGTMQYNGSTAFSVNVGWYELLYNESGYWQFIDFKAPNSIGTTTSVHGGNTNLPMTNQVSQFNITGHNIMTTHASVSAYGSVEGDVAATVSAWSEQNTTNVSRTSHWYPLGIAWARAKNRWFRPCDLYVDTRYDNSNVQVCYNWVNIGKGGHAIDDSGISIGILWESEFV